MAFPTPYLLTPAGTARGEASRWLAPPFAALVFLVQPCLVLLQPSWPLRDPGIGWHLATGRIILETGAIPSRDPFSFTAAGHPWINYYWLFEVAAALLERLGGLPLYATACMLVYAVVPVLLYRRMLDLGSSIVPALALTMVAQMILMSHAVARPHVVTYLLFAVFLARLDDVEHGRRPAAALWILPPLAALWSNLHAGFLAGLALAGIFAAVAAGRALLAPADLRARRRAGVFAGLLVALVLATAVNPHGFALHVDAIHHLGMQTTGAFDEFRTPNFQAPSRPVVAFEVLVLASLAAAVFAGGRIAVLELVLLAFFLHQALHAVRHMNLFAIVAAPIVARELTVAVAAAFPQFTARWRAIATEQAGLRSPPLYFAVIVSALLGSAVSGATGIPTTLDDLHLSRGAAAHIAAHREQFARPFNTDTVGGALIYRFAPDVRVFFDDRIFVYGDDFVARDYLPVHRARREWREILARHDVHSAVVASDSAAATLLRTAPEWRTVYGDDLTELFVREASPRVSDDMARDTDQRTADAVGPHIGLGNHVLPIGHARSAQDRTIADR